MYETFGRNLPGSQCTVETVKRKWKNGLLYLLNGKIQDRCTNETIEASPPVQKQHHSGLVIAGKMHGAGLKEPGMNVIAKRFY